MPRFRQTLAFILVGLLNTAFGYTIFVVGILVGMAPLLSLLTATVLGVSFNFVTTGRIVFGNSDPRRFGAFVLGYAAVYALNAGLLRALSWAGLPPITAQAICMFPVVCFAFFTMKRFVFARLPINDVVAQRGEC